MKSTKVVVVALALLLSACGGGGGGNDSPAPPTPATNLAGTWTGNYEDTVGVMFTSSVTIDATGKITQVLKGGTNQGLTGNIFVVTAPNLYRFTLSNGNNGGFFADTSATHAAFVDIDFNVGVLQKGAAVPTNTTFAATDIVGAWTGFNVDTDANLNVVRTYTSNATIANNGTRTFAGSDTQNGPYTGSFPGFVAADFGRWSGRFQNTNTAALAGDVHAFLSVDKTFAGTWACDDQAADFSGCTFSAWHK